MIEKSKLCKIQFAQNGNYQSRIKLDYNEDMIKKITDDQDEDIKR